MEDKTKDELQVKYSMLNNIFSKETSGLSNEVIKLNHYIDECQWLTDKENKLKFSDSHNHVFNFYFDEESIKEQMLKKQSERDSFTCVAVQRYCEELIKKMKRTYNKLRKINTELDNLDMKDKQ